jgi:hypothetical protein
MQEVHSYIKSEQSRYQIMPVPIVEGYAWSMFEHVRLTTLYLNSQFKTGKEDDKPFRNIILPKVNLEHRAVAFDLSEIEFYINSEDEDFKSFLVKKWHDRWAIQNGIADFLDELSETYTDYGGVLVKNTKDALEVVPFQRLAFCDQTDMLSGPICEQHEYSPDQLMDMATKGWGKASNGATGTLEEVIALAKEEKTNTQSQGGGAITTIPKAQTPGRYIEVFELHGMLPETFLNPDGDPNKFVQQMQVVTYYTPKGGDGKAKKGITLFAGKEKPGLYKAFKRDKIYGRALGRGAVEELFEPQVWVNYNEIAKTEILTQASKMLNWTNDQGFKARNDTSNLEQGDTLVVADNKTFQQVNTSPVNVVAFENAIQTWDQNAQQIAATTDLMAGSNEGASGLPAKLGIPLMEEGHSLHEYRKKRLGAFVSELYRDWILPKCQKAITGGDEFISDLSIDEMDQIVDQVVAYEFNQSMIKKVLSGEIVYPDDAQALEQSYRQQFFKTNRKFLKILEGELSDLPIDVEVNVAKSGPNALMAQKLGGVWSSVVNILGVNPAFFQQNPQMAKLFNQLLQAYGLSPISFNMSKIPLTPPQNANQNQGQPQGQPVQAQPQVARQPVQQTS